MVEPKQSRGPGRPRSERSRRAVLEAARDLLTDRGLPGLSVDEIAAHAGVSKNTIYRWWPTKAAVLMDAFTDAFADRMSVPAEGDALTRLRTTVRRVATLMSDPDARRPFVALVAAAQHDPELAAALRDRFIAGRRAEVGELLADARSTGRLPAGLDPDTAIDLIYGALYYRLLVSGETIDSGYADRILTAMGLLPD
ncbi:MULTISPECIES: TetR/AcrR family transcriptional regulator [Nocardia]|uniref:TetR family transcriptional regulator n=2 Tax=Nocardia TaxID=1817 RepID=A0A2T2Z4S2_9NOCA|nr:MULTISPECIES: TetR/AcrR family transcriptional regulator [Nocardia]MBF6449974.1 TetR/AcrR family transcriptional regulator [Nocardia elegans]PSR62740.1 TetR family transcriptional regulator [Nocardia nova]